MLSTELRLFPGSPSQFRCMSGAEPNATFRVGADGETGDFKGLTLSNSSPVHLGSRGFSLNRGRGGLGKGRHEHSLHLPRRHAAAEAAEATAPEATEAATAAPCRIARKPLRYAVTGLPGAATVAYLFPHHACPSAYDEASGKRPCLPTRAHTLPSGGAWLHEIKHDGFRIIARKNGAQVRLYSRPRNAGEASEDLS